MKKGQFTIIGIILVFISLVTFLALEPALSEVIDDANMTGSAGLMADLFPFFFLAGILITLLMYTQPGRQQ